MSIVALGIDIVAPLIDTMRGAEGATSGTAPIEQPTCGRRMGMSGSGRRLEWPAPTTGTAGWHL